MQPVLDTATEIQHIHIEDSIYADAFTGIMPAVTNLYVRSHNFDDIMSRPKVAIVGSRKVTPYGRHVTEQFAAELARSGVVIVSGLALGVDTIAHQAALDAGGLALAVMPGGLDKVYPASNRNLADRILKGGGALISEYAPGLHIMKYQFIGRNRIVSGISNALLITEAASNSGTMHTVRFALEQGKDVLAIPGNITSPLSEGTNNIIKAGGTPVTSAADVFTLIGVNPVATKAVQGSTPDQQSLLELLKSGVSNGDELLITSGLEVGPFNQSMTMMEITGKVRSLGANQWAIR